MSTKTFNYRDMPNVENLRINIGDDYESDIFRHKLPDGSARDLTGVTIEAKLLLADGTTEVTFGVERDDLEGEYYLTMSRSVTVDFAAQVATYWVSLIDALDKKLTYWVGEVPINNTKDGD